MYYGLADARISASEKDLPVEKMHICLYSKFCYAFASVNDFGTLKNYVHVYRLFFFRSTIQTKMLQRDCTYKNSTFYCFCLHLNHTDAARKTKVEFLNNHDVTFWVK